MCWRMNSKLFVPGVCTWLESQNSGGKGLHGQHTRFQDSWATQWDPVSDRDSKTEDLEHLTNVFHMNTKSVITFVTA